MRLGLILGDQLSQQLATLKALDREQDVILMAEVVDEATYVQHHVQKIALLFSAMRHFAKALKQDGWKIQYHVYEAKSPIRSLLDYVEQQQKRLNAGRLWSHTAANTVYSNRSSRNGPKNYRCPLSA